MIRHAVWLCFLFTLNIRDIEELLAQGGVEVSREALRCLVNKSGPLIAANLRRRRGLPTGRWHLDKMVVKITGSQTYLWSTVDDEGEVLDISAQNRRNKDAALNLLRYQGVQPETITTDKLASYRATARELGLTSRHRPGGMCENNRVENSHRVIRRRELKQQNFKSPGSAQRFLASHSAVYNTFNLQTHLISRPSLRILRAKVDRAWEAATVAA